MYHQVLHGSQLSNIWTNTITSFSESPDTPYTTTSTDLKIKLDNLVIDRKISVTVNGTEYVCGETPGIASWIVYQDSSGVYWLDLKLVKEILNMNDAEWDVADIAISYVHT